MYRRRREERAEEFVYHARENIAWRHTGVLWCADGSIVVCYRTSSFTTGLTKSPLGLGVRITDSFRTFGIKKKGVPLSRGCLQVHPKMLHGLPKRSQENPKHDPRGPP